MTKKPLTLVLIAEDDSAIADLIATVAEIAGATPMIASDGQQALLLAHACAPALVITDLEMPCLGGAALIATLRKESGTDLPVILVSAGPMAPMLAAGADAILRKPFAVADLLALLDRFLPGGAAYRPAAGPAGMAARAAPFVPLGYPLGMVQQVG